MPHPTSRNTDKDWAKKFYRELQSQEERVMPGYRTAEQWATLWDLSVVYARALILKAVRSRKMETKKFRIRSDQRVYPVPHYRVKNPPNRPIRATKK